MTTKTNAPYDDTTERQIVALETKARAALTAHQPIMEDLAAHLDALFAAGAPGEVLDDIQARAVDLVAVAGEQRIATQASLELARKIQQQRDQTRQALDNLKAAIKHADVDVPEISELWATIEEYVVDEMDLDEIASDHIANQAWFCTPLEFDEALGLLNILLGLVDVPPSSPLWPELKSWIARADRAEIEEDEVES